MTPAEPPTDEWQVVTHQRDQMLRLVTKGFFNELVNYGVKREEILRVATHLLDNVLHQDASAGHPQIVSGTSLAANSVQDHWRDERRLVTDQVTLRPLARPLVARLAEWLRVPEISESFFPPFPSDEKALEHHCCDSPMCDYLAIEVGGELVGIIGGENIDRNSRRLEMRKLVGDSAFRGRGIGKRATQAFLYYAFSILDMHKVYVHSLDINLRNLNINSSLGFELEGVFLEEIATPAGRRADVVRMALFKPIWLALFGG